MHKKHPCFNLTPDFNQAEEATTQTLFRNKNVIFNYLKYILLRQLLEISILFIILLFKVASDKTVLLDFPGDTVDKNLQGTQFRSRKIPHAAGN